MDNSIKNMIVDLSVQVFKKYSYVFFSEEEKSLIIEKIIKSETDDTKIIKKMLEDEIKYQISQKLPDINIINNYLKHKQLKKTKDGAIDYINNVDNFCKMFCYSLDENSALELIKMNKNLNWALYIYFNINKYLIIDGNIRPLSNRQTTLTLFKMFAINEGIEVKIEEDIPKKKAPVTPSKAEIVKMHQEELLQLFPIISINDIDIIANYLTAKEIITLFSDSDEKQEIYDKTYKYLCKKIYQRSIYETFEGFSEKDIDDAIDKLSPDEILIVRSRLITYGERDKLIKEIIPKIIKKLINKNSIYEFYNDYDSKTVDKCINSLCDDDKYFIEKFKKHELNKNEESYFCFNIIYKLSKKVYKYKTKTAQTIEYYFPGYSIPLVIQATDNLINEEKELFNKYFFEKIEINEKSLDKLKYTIIPKIKRKLKKIYGAKNIYELLYKYKKTEVNSVIKQLNDEEKHIIEEFNKTGKLNYEDFNTLNLLIIIKIKYLINESKIQKYKDIYDIFVDYDKKDIDEQLENLSISEKNTLDKYFTNFNNMSLKDKEHFELIISKIEKLLITQKAKKSIYEFLSDFTKEQIDKAIKKLSFNEREIFIKKFDETSSLTDKEKDLFYKNILPKVKRICQNLNENHRIKHNTIYDYFPGCDTLKIDLIVSTLNPDDQKLIQKRFINKKLTLSEKNRLYGSIFLIIKKVYASFDENNIHNVLKYYPDEMIDNVINFLSEEEKKSVSRRSTLGKLANISDSRTYYKVLPIIKMECLNETLDLLKTLKKEKNEEFLYTFNKDFTEQDYFDILDLLKNKKFIELEKIFSLQECFIIAMKLGFLNGKCFSTKIVSEFYNISEKEVNEIIYQYLITKKERQKKYVRTITRENK